MTVGTITRYIIWLNQVSDEGAKIVGSKATKLALLMQSGVSVPPGFCVTTTALQDFLDDLGRADLCRDTQLPDAELAARIRSHPMPQALATEVLGAYQRFCAEDNISGSVAVRSSAVSEDLPNASFAGQYTSVLNVTDEAGLLDAIRECWSSAVSAQVQAYRQQYNLQHAQVEMAVIVQSMVPAECAGVLFTVDPVTKNDHLVIELVPGLGDSVTAGAAMPIRLTLDRRTGVAELSTYTANQLGATRVRAGDWAHLRDVALRVEALFGSPQDIEWTYMDHAFQILQSRPITGARELPRRQIWTRANAGEILPGVVSPLTWSIFLPSLGAAGMVRALSPLTIHWDWQPPCGAWPISPRLFMGRAYMELATVYAGFGNLPGVTPDVLQRMLGFEFHLCRPEELPERRPRWHVMDPYRALRFWLEMLGLTKTLSRRAARWLDQTSRHPECQAPVEPEPSALLERIKRLLKEVARILGLHIQCTSMAFSAFGLLDQLVRKRAGPGEARTFGSGLIADFEGISTVQQGIAIWDLAQIIKNAPCAVQALMEFAPSHQVIKAWGRCPDAGELLDAWTAFLQRFGDRSTEEFELMAPHWDTDPTFVLQTIREIIEHGFPDPRDKLRQRRETSGRDMERMSNRFASESPPQEAWFFHRLLASYGQLVPLRENLKYCLVTRFNALRKTFLALGEILRQRELLASAEDIFFLEYDEIVALFTSASQPELDVASLWKQRRDEYDGLARASVPGVWVTIDGRDSPMELPNWQDADSLYGIGCSAGQITGPAHVLTTALQGGGRVPPGHILVTPSIDPGLTPLLLSASGLVTEIGGVLSHGATVAREYGIPTVVGVPHATKLIRNGQQIMVDGVVGQVHLGPSEGA